VPLTVAVHNRGRLSLSSCPFPFVRIGVPSPE
jgi:hypothetical protein